MARATLKLKRPITEFELDLDENSLEAVGFMRMSEPQTNADRLRAMTDEELAQWLDNNTSNFPIYFDWLDWLKSPVED